MEMYAVTIDQNEASKTLFTLAADPEEAGVKFNRHLTCQWVGRPWEDPDTFLVGVFDKLVDGETI